MDLTDALDQGDSGMESNTASKDETPERKPEDMVIAAPAAFAQPPAINNGPENIGKEYDNEPDETFTERLWGLTEMFPEPVRDGSYYLLTNTVSGAKALYHLTRSIVWVVASSSVILLAPVIFEVERAQVDEMQKSQQKQVLLGTNAALGGPPMPR